MIGPVFAREAVTSPRRPRLYVERAVYVMALLILMCTAWLVVAATQIIRNVGDMAHFGAILFQILAPLQMALFTFLAALVAASAISQEKDRRTLILLLMTRMSNRELVLGKLFASLLNVLVMLVAALPVFLCMTLLGGVSVGQVALVFAVTLTTLLASGSLGALVAFWREKTFQTLAMTALGIILWFAMGEAFNAGFFGAAIAGASCEAWGAALSPLRAILAAARPTYSVDTMGIRPEVLCFLVGSGLVAALINGITIAFVRRWNPSREVRPGQADAEESDASIWGAEYDLDTDGASEPKSVPEAQRAGHVDARVRTTAGRTREVWDNPVLWREVCTWAYGRKVLIIRVGYLFLFAMTAAGLYWMLTNSVEGGGSSALNDVLPMTALPLAPFFLASVVIINALAVTSITNERDGQALDLLLVTDLSPPEFVFGKLLGVFWVTKEMVVFPLLLCGGLCWQGQMTLEDLAFIVGGLLIMNAFAAMLGVHCGMAYANSRTAIGVSLGTVFFLFLGVVTCLLIMLSFSGSFQTQLTPFLAFIVGGSVGLFVALGSRNPSQAIFLASFLLPIATFYSITSFLLGHNMAVFLVTVGTYGFTIAAMMMPAIGEFDIAMGRAKTAED